MFDEYKTPRSSDTGWIDDGHSIEYYKEPDDGFLPTDGFHINHTDDCDKTYEWVPEDFIVVNFHCLPEEIAVQVGIGKDEYEGDDEPWQDVEPETAVTWPIEWRYQFIVIPSNPNHAEEYDSIFSWRIKKENSDA